jgi:hypothetical protein
MEVPAWLAPLLDGLATPTGNQHVNLLHRSDRYVYVRAAIPRDIFEALEDWLGSEGQALKALRLEFSKAIDAWAAELPPATPSDASSSAAGPGTSRS